ncbi:MAG TPA: hypothetical protein VF621_18240 [Pyrinomonadaceae bacterium]|jgi:uncharacterized protein YbjT (DUF2867 family)
MILITGATGTTLRKTRDAEHGVEGVERALLLTPPTANTVSHHRDFLAADAAAGVRHVVKLSAIGADAETDVARRVGRKEPTTFEQFARDHAGAFRGV